ncbi:HAD hydrolase family protein [Brevibacillus laterosporus]
MDSFAAMGIQKDQMVCFGNDLNDLPMFQQVTTLY